MSWKHHTPKQRENERAQRKTVAWREHIVRRAPDEAPREPSPIKCHTCFDMAHRRMGVCAECGEHYQAERIER